MTPKQILIFFFLVDSGIALALVTALVFLSIFATPSCSLKEIPEGSSYDLTVGVTYNNGDTAVRSFTFPDCDTVIMYLNNGDLNMRISRNLEHGGSDKEIPFSGVRSYTILKSEGYHPYVDPNDKKKNE